MLTSWLSQGTNVSKEEKTMFQTDFSPVELATRRQRVLDAIGGGAVALIQGSEKEGTHGLFRQYNDFYYLCAVEVPMPTCC